MSSQLPAAGFRQGSDSPASAHARDLQDYGDRLRSISEQSRKLLVQIAELAYHGRGQQRKGDVAYLPELHESCGLDVDAMYALLKELHAAKFIAVEEQYPFEDVKILPTASGWNALAAIAQRAEQQKVALRDVLVDLRIELLQ
ncbi:MAG TPA: hypothetical protein VG498_23125 [Terriglobales bacterium]|nr:hypothetical protein [Terriglobales bacterium]